MKTLIVGDLNPFVASIANRFTGSCFLANVLPDSNKSWLDNSVKVYYGAPDNENLVANILDNEKVDFIVFVPSGLGTVSNSKQSVVDFAKKQLHGIAHFLDGWRKAKTGNERTLVFLSSFAVYGENQNDSTNKTSLKPSTELGAALMGAEAFLHSYAVSYELNVKILRLRSNDSPKTLGDLMGALKSLGNHDSGVAEIFHMPSDTAADFSDDNVANLTCLPGWKEYSDDDTQWLNSLLSKTMVPAARFLVFGGKGWIGQQFVKLLEEKSIEAVVGETRPGTDPDQVIADEITKIAPSHVVSMIGRTHGPGCGNIDYLEGGPDKLKENVQDNLFAPWILANLCEQFGIHFTYLGTGCLYQYNPDHPRNGKGYQESDQPNFTGNKYSVVKGFTDQSVTFFKNTLNARIRLPVNDEDSPRNLLRKLISFKKVIDIPNSITYLPDCLPILLNLALQKETGTLNLVNPNTITFPRILEIFEEETGQKLEYEILPVEDDSPAFKTRAQCALDTSRLQSLVPGVLDIESAIRRAVAKVAAHLA